VIIDIRPGPVQQWNGIHRIHGGFYPRENAELAGRRIFQKGAIRTFLDLIRATA
jgi:hypothetical protein